MLKYPLGGLGNQPLNEIYISDDPELAGPFYGADAVHEFQNGCDIEIDGEVPVVFTHDDLVPPNIIFRPGRIQQSPPSSIGASQGGTLLTGGIARRVVSR